MNIRIDCPQCGGKIDFDEKSFVIRCDFCGSTLHLAGKNHICHFRLKPKWTQRRATHYLSELLRKKFGENVKLLKLKLLYAPYWRIHGTVFRWIFGKKLVKAVQSSPFGSYKEDTKKLQTKLLDLSFPAFQGLSFGLQSLGVRTSALPLLIFGNVPNEPDTFFVKTNTSFQDAVKYMKAFANIGLEVIDIDPELDDTQEVGEQYSIVYVPFWLIQVLAGDKREVLVVEAISHSTVKKLKRAEIGNLKKLLLKPDDSTSLPALKFIPFKCPECGWELPFHPYNSVHICKTCARGWFEYGGKFHRVNYRLAEPPAKISSDKTVFMPFWRIKVTITTKTRIIKSMSDITGKGYQPYRKSLLSSGQDVPMNFIVPAFTIKNSKAFNKLAAMLTANPSSYQFSDEVNPKKQKFGGVSLTFSEAEEMCRVVLLSLIPPFARKAVDELKEAKFKFSNHELMYLPFQAERLFLRDVHTGFAIQKGSIYLQETD